MAETFGSVGYEQARGRWYVDFRSVHFPGSDQPRRIRIFATPWQGKFERKGQAKRALDRIRGKCEDKPLHQVLSEFLDESAPELCVERYWSDYLEKKAEQCIDGDLATKRLAELRSYGRRGYLKPLLKKSVHSITFAELDDWLRWLRRKRFEKGPLSDKSIRHVVQDFAGFLRWLKKRGEIAEVPEILTVRIREPYAPRIPSTEAQEAVLETIPEEKRGLFMTRSYMGLRPSEARKCRVSAYRPDTGLLVLTDTKTRRMRALPLDPDVAAWLAKHVDPRDRLQGDPPLFRNPDGIEEDKRWTPSSERRVWLAACEEVGVRIKPNEGGRHAFATHAAERGVPQILLQQFMGHSDPRTTGRYVDLAGAALLDVLRSGHQVDTAGKSPEQR